MDSNSMLIFSQVFFSNIGLIDKKFLILGRILEREHKNSAKLSEKLSSIKE